MKDLKTNIFVCILVILFTPKALFYCIVSSLSFHKLSSLPLPYVKRSEVSIKKTTTNSSSINGNINGTTNSTNTTNATNYVYDTVQLAESGEIFNLSLSKINTKVKKIETDGFKVLDFIQACYAPTNLSVCGVNSPVYYLLDNQVGTPAQSLQSLIDINIYESYYSTCDTLNQCPVSKSQNLYSCMYNSYSPNISFTFNYDNSSFFTNFLTSGSVSNIQGCWSWDNASFGSIDSQYSVANLSYFVFPTVNANNDNVYFEGVLGLGSTKMISRDGFISDKQRKKYYNGFTANYSNSLLNSLQTYGSINRQIYSMYTNEDGTGKLILGGIDSAKIGPDFTIYKNIQSKFFDTGLYKTGKKYKNQVYRPFININYISINGLTNYMAKPKQYVIYDAVIESTERSIYGPKKFVQNIAKHYSLENKDDHYYINCSMKGDPLIIGLSQGLNITIPWEDLKFINLDPSTNNKSNQNCVFALNYKKQQTNYFVLGQTFLNNVYFLSDLEKNSFGLGQIVRSERESIIGLS